MATIVLAPEPLTRYAVGRTVEERFGGEQGVLRTKMQHAFDQVPSLERAGLIRAVGKVPVRGGRDETSLLAATQAGVKDWRGWLASPIRMPGGMKDTLIRLKAVRPADYATMVQIVDRFEATLQRTVQQAIDPGEPDDIPDRVGLLWNKRELVAQLQWCQHSRDIFHEAMGGQGR